MKSLIILFLSISSLLGCSSPSYNYVPSVTKISYPPLNEIVTVGVGDTLLVQGKSVETDAFHALSELKISSIAGVASYRVMPGYYRKSGEDDKSLSFYIDPVINTGLIGSSGGFVTINGLADPAKSISIPKNSSSTVCIITVFNMSTCSENAPVNIVKAKFATRDTFQQTLIYTGRVGSKINIAYREFSGDLARPAFNTTAEYDLDISDVIGYKGAKIQIIEATNQQLKYKVLSNFNLAQY